MGWSDILNSLLYGSDNKFGLGDVARLGGIGALLYGITNPNDSKTLASFFGGSSPQVGYQGGIPNYTATREVVPGTNPPGRLPGSSGQRYFTDVQYEASGNMAPQFPTAAQLAQQNAQGLDLSALLALLQAQGGVQGGTQDQTPQFGPLPPAGGTQPTQPTQPTQTDDLGLDYYRQAYPEFEWYLDSSGNISYTNPASSAPKTTGDYVMVAGLKVPREDYISGAYKQPGYTANFAAGGVASLPRGYYLGGPTDGMADKVPASIEGRANAALSHGEFVLPADVVSHLGNGNSEAGAEVLYDMMDRIRKARTGTEQQGRKIDPNKFLPK